MSWLSLWPSMSLQQSHFSFILSQQSALGAGAGAAWACATPGMAIVSAIAVKSFFMSKNPENRLVTDFRRVAEAESGAGRDIRSGTDPKSGARRIAQIA